MGEWAKGAQVGLYRVVARVSAGGMGETYRARREYEGVGSRDVCLKRMLPGSDSATRERFEREARALLTLDHPGIVRFVDYFEHDGEPVLAMEWVEGRELRIVAATQRMEAPLVAYAAGQIARALEHAHDAGQLHRDLSPDNIMLVQGGTAKLLDFGLARAIDEARQLTGSQEWVGKPEYAAPETQGTERPAPAADMYSLGATLYEVLSGVSVQREPGGPRPKPLRKVVHRVPRELAGLVDELLDQVPANRPSAEEAADRFEALAIELPGEAEGWDWRRRAPMLALVAMVLVIAFTGAPRAEPPAEPASSRSEVEPTPAELTPEPAPSAVAEAEAGPPPGPAIPEPATVRVVVAPWGDFAVDGGRRQRAPRTVRLDPGEYAITAYVAGQEKRTRRVRVRAGQARKVLFQ